MGLSFIIAKIAIPALLVTMTSDSNSSSSNGSLPSTTTTTTLFVWDFDWTVINCNSDEYIPAQFLDKDVLKDGFKSLYASTNGDWHACVEGMVNQCLTSPLDENYSNDESKKKVITKEDVMNVARQMPYLEDVRHALDDIHSSVSSQQMILSDGNTLFINEFLQHQQIQSYFQHVVSNKGEWTSDCDGNEKLKVTHQSVEYGGHDCTNCSANLCKTQALQETLIQLKGSSEDDADRPPQPQRRRIVYVGDGANDACPVLNVLGPDDIMLARTGHKRICANERKGPESDEEAICYCDNGDSSPSKHGSPFGIMSALEKAKAPPKCQVLQWNTGRELRDLIQNFLKDSS